MAFEFLRLLNEQLDESECELLVSESCMGPSSSTFRVLVRLLNSFLTDTYLISYFILLLLSCIACSSEVKDPLLFDPRSLVLLCPSNYEVNSILTVELACRKSLIFKKLLLFIVSFLSICNAENMSSKLDLFFLVILMLELENFSF